MDYLEFRADLELAITDTAVKTLTDDSAMQDRLAGELAVLATHLRVDTLVATLSGDPVLRPLAGAVRSKVNTTLERDEFGDDVHQAFRAADGQRLAVDAVMVGLAKALRRVSVEREP